VGRNGKPLRFALEDAADNSAIGKHVEISVAPLTGGAACGGLFPIIVAAVESLGASVGDAQLERAVMIVPENVLVIEFTEKNLTDIFGEAKFDLVGEDHRGHVGWQNILNARNLNDAVGQEIIFDNSTYWKALSKIIRRTFGAHTPILIKPAT
jgi:hypothetical protein